MLRRYVLPLLLITALSIGKPAHAGPGKRIMHWCQQLLTWVLPPPHGLRFGSPARFDLQSLLLTHGIKPERLKIEEMGSSHVQNFHDLYCINFRLHYADVVVGEFCLARESLRTAHTYAYLAAVNLNPVFANRGLEFLLYFFSAYEADRRWNNALQVNPLHRHQKPDIWEELANRKYAVYARNDYMSGARIESYYGYRFRAEVLTALRDSELAP